MIVKNCTDEDFEGLTALYGGESSYGGHYDKEHDNRERLRLSRTVLQKEEKEPEKKLRLEGF